MLTIICNNIYYLSFKIKHLSTVKEQRSIIFLFLYSELRFQILENIAENIEEIEEEFLVFRDLSSHPNIPEFFGLFLKRGVSAEDDQIWFVMEVCISLLYS